MSHTFRNHHFHLIWSTKHRKNLIEKHFQERLYSYMGGIIRENKGTLVQIGGTENHVHLLIGLGPIDKYSELIRTIKAGSSMWLHKNGLKNDFAWQNNYASFCVSYSQLGAVQKYIMNQEKHHKKLTFEEEYIEFLKINGLDYDEKYVFD
jgi:putative transposase